MLGREIKEDANLFEQLLKEDGRYRIYKGNPSTLPALFRTS